MVRRSSTWKTASSSGNRSISRRPRSYVSWAPGSVCNLGWHWHEATLLTGMPFTDTTSGFKCWRDETLRSIKIEEAFANGYLFQIETTYKAYRRGLRVREIPIIFFERDRGRSKFDFRIIVEAVFGVIRLRVRR